MALDGTIVFEVQTVGNDDNGGGYSSDDGGTDYSQQAAAELTLTDLECVIASTTLTSVTGGFTAAMIDNLIQIKSGTNFLVGFYRIVSRANTNTVTLDRTASDGSNATSGTGSVGGTLATPGMAAGPMDKSGMKTWVKSGTYELTTASTNVSGGVVSLADGVSAQVTMQGYNSVRGDLDDVAVSTNKPILKVPDAGIDSVALFTVDTAGNTTPKMVLNLIADGNGKTGVTGFALDDRRTRAVNCKAQNCVVDGFKLGNLLSCEADTCGDGFDTPTDSIAYCEAYGCTNGFMPLADGIMSHCLAYRNTKGFVGNSARATLSQCTAHGNSSHGVDPGQGWLLTECVMVDNGGFGVDSAADTTLMRSAFFNNSSGPTNVDPRLEIGRITLTGDPFDEGSDDYRPNDVAGQGAELRGAGLGHSAQTNNVDIGAVQHTDPAGGGGGTSVIIPAGSGRFGIQES